MGVLSELSAPMEGWLYVVRSNRLGLQSSRKRYFVIEDNALHCFKAMPSSKKEDPIKSASIDSSMRVIDNGRESVHGNVFYIFTLKNASKGNDQLRLGARSSEEAARWIKSLMEAVLKESPEKEENSVDFSKRRSQSSRSNHGRRHTHSIDWTFFPSVHTEPVASDVIAPSTWQIVGCKNGIRLFKEARDADLGTKCSDEHPAIMAVGVVDATSESVFQTVMSLGPSRSEWDFCLLEGSTVEHLDGHTDIIHKKLRADWLPWGMKQRDLLLRRYWRREDDGTYVILYHSVFHQKCRLDRDYIRAWLKSGGYVISPVNQGKQSVVKHMLAIDWKFWKSYLFTQSEKYITMRMLGRIAALREFFRAKLGNSTYSDFSSIEIAREIGSPQSEKEEIKLEVQRVGENNYIENSAQDPESSTGMLSNTDELLLPLNEAADEFFDVLNEPEYDQTEAFWSSDESMQSQLAEQDQCHSKLSTAAEFVKKLQAVAAHSKGYVELEEGSRVEATPCIYGATLPKDQTCDMPCSWAMADPSTFLIRGESYLHDHQKIKANGTLMQMVAADWLSSDKREDDLGGRPGGIVQRYAEQGGSEFFFIVNIQVPGSTMYSLALYYMMDTPLEKVPLLESFVKRDDTYRNSRFKLIPYISKGSWIVKQSVGKKAGLVGQALAINYFHGSNYIELGVDVGSSTVARGVVSLVLGCLNNLVIEMAFLIQGNTQEELPEFLLGTCRLNHLDASKAVPVNS